MVFAAMKFGGIHPGQHPAGDLLFSGRVQHTAGAGFRPSAPQDPAEHRAVNDGLAELFHQVERERGFAGTVNVHEPREGFEAGIHRRAPHMRGKNAVPVVEAGVDGIGSAGMPATAKLERIGKQVHPLLPVNPAGYPFEPHKHGAGGRHRLGGMGQRLPP